MLTIVPISFKDACQFVDLHHRHHRPPQGHKFSIGVSDAGRLVGVATVGRPVARRLDNGTTLQVTRVCTDGTRHACSMLHAACWRAAKALGYQTIVTYILDTEPEISLHAAGWTCAGKSGGYSWNVPSRPRQDKCPHQLKIKFIKAK